MGASMSDSGMKKDDMSGDMGHGMKNDGLSGQGSDHAMDMKSKDTMQDDMHGGMKESGMMMDDAMKDSDSMN